jgi:hypothetical protein
MFDNVAFNVVIGLVLIYLLYSLLVTIVGEVLSTWFGIRPRILRVAIERMLNDGYYKSPRKKNWWYRIQSKIYKQLSDLVPDQGFFAKLFLQTPEKFKTSFAGRFYEYPSIKYLAQVEGDQKGILGQTKPSYISAETFANTLINMFLDKGRGCDKMDQIRFSLQFNTWHLQDETLKQLKNILDNYGSDVNSFRDGLIMWFNETMDRANGWYKSKLRLILFFFGLALAFSFDVDSIRIARILSNDKEARTQLVNMGIAMSKDTSGLQPFVGHGADSVKSNAVIDTGFSRVTKDISAANLILGLGWEFEKLGTGTSTDLSEKGDTVRYNDLSTLKSLHDSLAKAKDNAQSLLAADRDSIDSLKRAIWLQQIDSLLNRLAPDTAHNKTNPTSAPLLLKKYTLRVSKDSFVLAAITKDQHTVTDSVNALLDSRFKKIDSIPASGEGSKLQWTVHGERAYTWYEKIGHIFINGIKPVTLAGLIITALALSLGAPFWFDLLNKLVSLRGAGVKPEEQPDADPNTPAASPLLQPIATGTAPVVPAIIADPVDQVMASYGGALRSIPGVKSLFKTPTPTGPRLQINVMDNNTAATVNAQLPSILPNVPATLYTVVVSGTPTPHLGPANSIAISNVSGQNGFGSLGCVLVDTTTQKKHILSCWHVMKGDAQYDKLDNLKSIQDSNSNALATRWAGGISGAFDFGIAELDATQTAYTNATQLKGLTTAAVKSRPLTTTDITGQIAVQFLDCFTGILQNGFVFCDTPSVQITYADKARNVEDVLVLANAKQAPQQTISQGGNSGALVLDGAGVAIALIIAGDDNYTYAMKISNFFNLHTEMNISI